jgi:hypothetical protein
VEEERLIPVKVALTMDQVRRYGLPPGGRVKAKESDKSRLARKKRYVAKYKTDDVWELEALDPAELQRLLWEAIDAYLDLDAYNAEIDAEAEDAARLDGLRKAVNAMLLEPGVLDLG